MHLQVEGSLLASMFSGRWEQSLDHDSHGRIFLDFEPYCFKQILTSLRCRQMQMGQEEKLVAPVIEQGMQQSYACLANYLGLEDAFGPCLGTNDAKTSDGLKFALVSDHVFIRRSMVEGCWTETADISEGFAGFDRFVMAGPKMTSGHVYYLKVLFTRPVSFIGIAKDGTLEENSPNATAYGWSHQQQQCLCWSAGAATTIPQAPNYNHATHASEVLLRADLVTGDLAYIDSRALHQERPVQYVGCKMQVPIPSQAQQSYMFQVAARINQITLLPVNDADVQLFAKVTFCTLG